MQGFTPSEVSTLNVPGAVAVVVVGNLAYITAGSNGLVVVDVADRTHPFIRSTLPGVGNAQGIRVAGEYAFIADATGFLQVVHILNPDAPTLLAPLPIPGNPIALAVHFNLALFLKSLQILPLPARSLCVDQNGKDTDCPPGVLP